MFFFLFIESDLQSWQVLPLHYLSEHLFGDVDKCVRTSEDYDDLKERLAQLKSVNGVRPGTASIFEYAFQKYSILRRISIVQ